MIFFRKRKEIKALNMEISVLRARLTRYEAEAISNPGNVGVIVPIMAHTTTDADVPEEFTKQRLKEIIVDCIDDSIEYDFQRKGSGYIDARARLRVLVRRRE